MELRHLRYFVALAECLHFTRAAERVHITQSTLSHQIQQLEAELGKQLFERVGRHVVITEDGELFLGHAINALKQVDHAVALLKESPPAIIGSLNIGVTHTFNTSFIPACVAELLSRHPTVDVTIYELTAAGIEDKLEKEQLDMGLTYDDQFPETLKFEALYSEQMVLVVSKSHPLAKRKRLRLAELHNQPLVLLPQRFATRQMLDKCFIASGASPVIVAQMDTAVPMLGLVERSQIGAIVSLQAISKHHELVIIPLESPTPMRTSGILRRRGHSPTLPMKSFMGIVRNFAKQLGDVSAASR